MRMILRSTLALTILGASVNPAFAQYYRINVGPTVCLTNSGGTLPISYTCGPDGLYDLIVVATISGIGNKKNVPVITGNDRFTCTDAPQTGLVNLTSIRKSKFRAGEANSVDMTVGLCAHDVSCGVSDQLSPTVTLSKCH